MEAKEDGGVEECDMVWRIVNRQRGEEGGAQEDAAGQGRA